MVTVLKRPSKRSLATNRSVETDPQVLQLAQTEVEYIFNSSFQDSGADQLLSPTAIAETPATSPWKPGYEMPAHLVRMCERKLLSPAEEQAYFRRMNYAKYKADCLRRKIKPNHVRPELIAEIKQLLDRALQDRNEIVRANLRLVVSIAKKFSSSSVPFDDLLSEGIDTLVRAAEKFDCDRGFRFSTYATQAIRRTLGRYLQTQQRDRQRFIAGEASILAEQPEVVTNGISVKRFEELRSTLKRLLGKLDPRERAIINQRFGLDYQGDVRTLQSLAHEMGVCKERVRQLEIRAISKLRALADKVQLRLPEDE